MIAGEIADQSAEMANVIKQLLVNAALRATVGFTKGLFGASCVSCPETGEGKLTQKWRLRSSRSRRLFEILHRFPVPPSFEGDRAERGKWIVAQLAGGDLQRIAREIAGIGEVVAELRLGHGEFVCRHAAGQLIDFLVLAQTGRDPACCSESAGVSQGLQECHNCGRLVGRILRPFPQDRVSVDDRFSNPAEGRGKEGCRGLKLGLARRQLKSFREEIERVFRVPLLEGCFGPPHQVCTVKGEVAWRSAAQKAHGFLVLQALWVKTKDTLKGIQGLVVPAASEVCNAEVIESLAERLI